MNVRRSPGNADTICARLVVSATEAAGANVLAHLPFNNPGAGLGSLLFDADGNGVGSAVVIAQSGLTTGKAVSLTLAEFSFL